MSNRPPVQIERLIAAVVLCIGAEIGLLHYLDGAALETAAMYGIGVTTGIFATLVNARRYIRGD